MKIRSVLTLFLLGVVVHASIAMAQNPWHVHPCPEHDHAAIRAHGDPAL